MPREQVIAALDIGSTKICTLVAEVDQHRQINVVGVGTAPSRGMKKGVVVNIDEAAHAIMSSVSKCERLSGYAIDAVYAGVTGSHIDSVNRRGVVAVSPHATEITGLDVERAMEVARVQAISNDREIIHVLPRGYILDGQDGVRDPVGMAGRRLEAEMHIITGATSAIHNVVRSVRRAGLQIEELISQPLASAEAVLNPTEKDVGVAVADIGGGTTDIAIFSDGEVYHTGVVTVAGSHITNDLARLLGASLQDAEQIKIRYGSAASAEINAGDSLEIPTYDHPEGELIARRLVAEIIESRMQEIFSLIQVEISRAGFENLLPAGLMLVGGTAELRDIQLLGREILGMPVRVGIPTGAIGLTDSIMRPAYATAIGLLQWAAYHTEDMGVPAASYAEWRALGRVKGWFRHNLGGLFREFLT
jgi:cell division protein FtsA